MSPLTKDEIIARFANPAVKDTTSRVSKDAPLQVVETSARDQLDSGGSYELLALNTAAWMRRFRVETNELGGRIAMPFTRWRMSLKPRQGKAETIQPPCSLLSKFLGILGVIPTF